MEEITESLHRRLSRRFGDRVVCRFVDVQSDEIRFYPDVQKKLEQKRVKLPVVAIGGRVRYSGVFSPTFIQRDLRSLVSTAASNPDDREERRRQARRSAFFAYARSAEGARVLGKAGKWGRS